MKNKKVAMNLGVVVLISIMTIISCTQKPVDVKEQIRRANSEFMAAVGNADTSQLSALYTKDAKLFPSHNPVVEGKGAIIGFWAANLQKGIKKVVFETLNAQGFGKIAIEEGTFKLFIDKDIMIDEGKYIVTWKNEGGNWKIYRDIWNSDAPAVQARASVNENVMIVLNHIKGDKVAQFEDFYKNYLAVAGEEFYPVEKKTIRVQKPVYQNADGTYTYLFIMDPFKDLPSYDMGVVLSAKYGEQKANEYIAMYRDCLKDQQPQALLAVETDW